MRRVSCSEHQHLLLNTSTSYCWILPAPPPAQSPPSKYQHLILAPHRFCSSKMQKPDSWNVLECSRIFSRCNNSGSGFSSPQVKPQKFRRLIVVCLSAQDVEGCPPPEAASSAQDLRQHPSGEAAPQGEHQQTWRCWVTSSTSIQPWSPDLGPKTTLMTG